MQKQLLKKLLAFIVIMMFSIISESAIAQKNKDCNAGHPCPLGDICVHGICLPNGSCNCAVRNYGCSTSACVYYCSGIGRCGVGFLPDENNGTSVTTISSNPVSQLITINFHIEGAGNVSLKIHDLTGRLIKTLAGENMQPGIHQIEWNSRDENGNIVSTGVYLLQLDTGNKSEIKKLSVIN